MKTTTNRTRKTAPQDATLAHLANSRSCQTAIAEITTKTLLLETLETRGWDRHDFHELAVWQLKDALEQAFAAGAKAGLEAGVQAGLEMSPELRPFQQA